MKKVMKQFLAISLAFLMALDLLGIVGSAKGNSTETIDPVGGDTATSAHGTVTYGLDIYKVTGDSLTKLDDGSCLSPGDVIEVQLCFGTDFYLGFLSSQIYYDSTYFEPYAEGAVYTDVETNTFYPELSDTRYIKVLNENAPVAQTINGDNVTLFDTITALDKGGYQGNINWVGNDTIIKQWTPVTWRVPNKQGKQTIGGAIASYPMLDDVIGDL